MGEGTDLFFGSEIVNDIENSPDLLNGLPPYHIGYTFRTSIPRTNASVWLYMLRSNSQ